jgi:hypothetical protein
MFHLITTPYSTGFGLYKASLEALAAEMRWTLPRYKKAFKEASSKGFVMYDEKVLLIWIPNLIKYNPPNNPNVFRSWGKLFNELPDSVLKNECYQVLKPYSVGKSEAFAKAFKEAFNEAFISEHALDMVKGLGSSLGEETKETVVESSTLKESFDSFWSLYPKKVEKKKSRDKWGKLAPDEVLTKRIMDALAIQIKSEQWNKEKGRFVPSPLTWLNGERWEDVLTSETDKPKWNEYQGG